MTVPGAVDDHTGLPLPAGPEQFLPGAAEYLTTALRRFGTLAGTDRVTAVPGVREITLGSTGRKLRLDVRYADPHNGLPTELFVKFSRDLRDPRRDHGRTQMDLEVRFARLCRDRPVPVPVPRVLFAGYHSDSGTGLLISETVPFGRPPVEPHYDKCLDQLMPEPLAHYRALLSALARLAGAHRAGRLGPDVAAEFAFDPEKVTVGARLPRSDEALHRQVSGYAQFTVRYPGLLPEPLRDTGFLDRMAAEVTALFTRYDEVTARLAGTTDHVALCHWNANVDNAWFWRDSELRCGLLDWGCVSVMNVAMALWGALSAAETWMWERHLDDLLTHFAAEYTAAGGPAPDIGLLRAQLVLYATVMGVTWLLDVPAYLEASVPDLADVPDRTDPRISGSEVRRSRLLMMTNFLWLWRSHDVPALLAGMG